MSVLRSREHRPEIQRVLSPLDTDNGLAELGPQRL